MRTEKEMYDLILSIAQSDERIRAVYLNGSRINIKDSNKNGYLYSSRGTFIGDTFYLLTRNGNVKSYDLDT